MKNTEKQPGQLSTLIAEQLSRDRWQYSRKNAWKNASTAALVTSTACKLSGYASDTGHKLVISRHSGSDVSKTSPSGSIFDTSLVPWYNLNLYLQPLLL